VPLSALRSAGALILVLGAFFTAVAQGALVEVEGLVLHADGGFQPQALPRHGFAPIRFEGHVGIAARGGGRPSPLRQAIVDFDRDGRLSVAGLPSCRPERIAAASTSEARQLCGNAIVGSGTIEALIAVGAAAVPVRSPLTIFNGPRVDGHPTAVLHARTTVPSVETYAIEVPIERRRGEFRYRVTLDVPPIAGGLGAITGIRVAIGRRYRAGGKRRSYVSAHCSDGILRTHGRFSFEDGTIIDGSVERYCRAE